MTLDQVLALAGALNRFHALRSYRHIGNEEALALVEAWRGTGVVVSFEAKETFDHYNAACCLAIKDESERALIETIMKKRARVVAELIDDAAFPKKVEEAVEEAVEEPAPDLSEDRPVRPNPDMPQPPDDEVLF